jgi:hypothetical protein
MYERMDHTLAELWSWGPVKSKKVPRGLRRKMREITKGTVCPREIDPKSGFWKTLFLVVRRRTQVTVTVTHPAIAALGFSEGKLCMKSGYREAVPDGVVL